MRTSTIKHTTPQHNEWMRALTFYEQELNILDERLQEIAGDNTGHEVAENVEYFQNQLIIHRDYIDGLKHRIRESMQKVEHDINHLAGHIKESTAEGYDKLMEDFGTEERMVNELRQAFNRFASKWM
ncbi:hypothetical protein MUY27_01375 [Mucilaginibacter sp. RS28]|uniref:Uncharacterized protein n=1 Tax=Mucilaginibacter straminoryzae TaxID=2932774 RepID=A0A9X1X4D2_9SPHI|nr:hypothetical protein [Mucilaginibacter straminoryzae]MCJ8208339.1 hypothetical protein [Mucilaginibacter straminoryzae]